MIRERKRKRDDMGEEETDLVHQMSMPSPIPT